LKSKNKEAYITDSRIELLIILYKEIYLTSLTFSELQQFTQSFNTLNVDFISEEMMQTYFTAVLQLVDLGILYNLQEQSWSGVADLIY